MIPVNRLLLKLLRDRHSQRHEFELVIDSKGTGELDYINLEDVMIDEKNKDNFIFIDENDSFVKIPFSDVKKVLRNEQPVWERERQRWKV